MVDKTILVPESNFDSDELSSGKEIAFLYIPLVVVVVVKMLAPPLVLLNKVNLSGL